MLRDYVGVGRRLGRYKRELFEHSKYRAEKFMRCAASKTGKAARNAENIRASDIARKMEHVAELALSSTIERYLTEVYWRSGPQSRVSRANRKFAPPLLLQA